MKIEDRDLVEKTHEQEESGEKLKEEPVETWDGDLAESEFGKLKEELVEEKLTETEEQVLASEFILGQGNTLARDQTKQKRLSYADPKVEQNYDKELSNRLNIKLNNSSEKVIKN